MNNHDNWHAAQFQQGTNWLDFMSIEPLTSFLLIKSKIPFSISLPLFCFAIGSPMKSPRFSIACCRVYRFIYFCMLDTVKLFDKNQICAHDKLFQLSFYLTQYTLLARTHTHTLMNWRWKMFVVRVENGDKEWEKREGERHTRAHVVVIWM